MLSHATSFSTNVRRKMEKYFFNLAAKTLSTAKCNLKNPTFLNEFLTCHKD